MACGKTYFHAQVSCFDPELVFVMNESDSQVEPVKDVPSFLSMIYKIKHGGITRVKKRECASLRMCVKRNILCSTFDIVLDFPMKNSENKSLFDEAGREVKGTILILNLDVKDPQIGSLIVQKCERILHLIDSYLISASEKDEISSSAYEIATFGFAMEQILKNLLNFIRESFEFCKEFLSSKVV